MTNEHAAFWAYSVKLYETAAQVCLHLQDRHGLDVNLLLLCCWSGERGRSLEAPELEALVEAVAPWRANVIEPLRRTRGFLKGVERPVGAPDLRRDILALELEAERCEQALLIDGLTAPMVPSDAAGAERALIAARNLRAYLRLSDVEPLGDACDAITRLLSAGFPDLDDAAIVQLMREPNPVA